ncbi:MAG TPA: hypothetical protein VMI11_14905 [Actinomycetes bacterium]|nr:hypothetical protein [Actinomycetes bacterium]
MTTDVATRRLNAWVGALVGLVSAAVVLGPVLVRRGYVLSYDMVFVPHMPVTATTWGADGSTPRAVPEDLLVALAEHLVPGDVVQKLLLCLVFVLGASGAARLVPGIAGGVGAAVVFVWNPWVLERLVIGHWAYLLGLAVLPWVVEAAGRLRAGEPTGGADTAVWVVVAGLCGSTSGLVGAGCALLVGAWPLGAPYRRQVRRVVTGVVVPGAAVAMVWVVPEVVRSGGLGADPTGVAAFAARADTGLGTWGSLLTLGGLWNPATWPAERGGVLLPAAALVTLVAAFLLGLPRLLGSSGPPFGPGLCAAGALGLLLAGAGATPGLSAVLRDGQGYGLGLLRDGQKLLMPFVLLTATVVGLAVDRLVRRVGAAAPLAVALVAVPVIALPSLAWGVGGRLQAVDYPQEWVQVQRLFAHLPHGGDVVSLPFTAYRRPSWNGERVTLDPMGRLLGRVVLVNDSLPLARRTVRGENPRAARVAALVEAGSPLAPGLRAEGVGFAVIDLTAPGAEQAESALAGSSVLHRGPGLLVLDLGTPQPPPRRSELVAGAVLGWLLLAAAVVAVTTRRALLVRRPSLVVSSPAPAPEEATHEQR